MKKQETRREGPTAHEWSRQRNTIIDLYKVRGHDLSFVQEHMRRHHDFHASPKMYKDRFRKWGVRKNRNLSSNNKASDKDVLAPTTIAPVAAAGSDGSLLLLLPDPQARIVFFQGAMDGPKAFQAALNAVYEYSPCALLPLQMSSSSPGKNEGDVGVSEISSSSNSSSNSSSMAQGARFAAAARLIRRGEIGAGFQLVSSGFHDFTTSIVVDGGGSAGGEAEILYVIGYGAMALLSAGEELFGMWLRFVARLIASVRGSTAAPMVRYATAMLALGAGGREEVRRACRALVPLIDDIMIRRLGEEMAMPEGQIARHRYLSASCETMIEDEEAWVESGPPGIPDAREM